MPFFWSCKAKHDQKFCLQQQKRHEYYCSLEGWPIFSVQDMLAHLVSAGYTALIFKHILSGTQSARSIILQELLKLENKQVCTFCLAAADTTDTAAAAYAAAEYGDVMLQCQGESRFQDCYTSRHAWCSNLPGALLIANPFRQRHLHGALDAVLSFGHDWKGIASNFVG